MAKIQYLDKDGLQVFATEIKKRMANVYDIKGSAVYADAAYLADPAHPREINSTGLWQHTTDTGWVKITAVNPGWIYNIINDFTTDSDFIEGAGKAVAAGINIVAVNLGTSALPNMKWDLMAAAMSLDAYQTKLMSAPISLITPDYNTYSTIADLPTTAADITADGISDGETAILDNNDIYRVEVNSTTGTGTWHYLGNQTTVEGMLNMLASIAPNTPITAAEIRAMFN